MNGPEGKEPETAPETPVRKRRSVHEGMVAVMRVARLGEMGAFLDAETGNTSDDVLLHSQQQTAPVAVGDEVYYGKFGGNEVKVDGEDYLLLRADDIYAIIVE